MPFLVPLNRTKNSSNHSMQLIMTGIFIGLSYLMSLLPLALFAIAQTLAIFGTRVAMLLSLTVVLCLIIFTIVTGFPVFAIASIFAILSVPIFLIISILRKKNKSIFLSATILATPIVLIFSVVLSAPILTADKYNFEMQKIETLLIPPKNTILGTDNKELVEKDKIAYATIKEQLKLIKHDINLQNFMSWNVNQRIIYFIYGSGFPILFGILLSFFASLFFLDFAFEQIEKLYGVANYVTTSRGGFDRNFLELLKILKRSNNKEAFKNLPFTVVKHKKLEFGITSNISLAGFFRNQKKSNDDINTIKIRDYIFYYIGRLPGWHLRTYQIPLILCIFSIMLFAGTVFYFGNFQNILAALASGSSIFLALGVILSVIAICVISFLVLQGIFTALRWMPFGLLLFISVVFLIIAPYIIVSIAPYILLTVFGIIGLLSYLK